MDLPTISQTTREHQPTHSYITTNISPARFKGIRLDTFGNRTSIMGNQQFDAYCHDFGTKPSIIPSHNLGINGIVGVITGKLLVLVYIPFKDLNLLINEKILLVTENIPTLLSMKDMKTNGLYIPLQEETIIFGWESQKLIMDNVFLKHNWSPADLSFSLDTELELRKIHRAFGHPSIGATHLFTTSSKGGHLD